MTELPLSDRVSAPAVLDLPTGPGALSWRSATVADIPALYALEREVSAADHPHYTTPLEEFEDDFSASFIDTATDTVVAVEPDGTIQGWGLVILSPGQRTLVRTILAGSVRPSARGRGIGRRILSWQIARAEQLLASSDKTLPGWVLAYVQENVADARALFERAGLSIARYFLELRRDLSQPIPELGGELTIERFTPERSVAVHAAVVDAFQDHWASQPMSDEQWESFTARSIARPDLSAVAIIDGEVAGFVLVSVNEEDWEGQGFSSAYIDLVGVPRAFRGRGIAPALLAHTMRAMAAEGLDKAVLDVDSDSPTGALGLYRKVGFVESHRSIAYNREY
ncbi:GNAT family N-acetyltransferase [Schumannella luteola]